MKDLKGGLSRRQMLGISIGMTGLTLSDKVRASLNSENSAPRAVTIAARPTPIDFDVATTAVIVVDMQNDFGADGGMFQRAGIDISMIKAAVGPTAKVLSAARKHGLKIVYLKMAFKPDLSDAGSLDSVNRVRHLKFMNVGAKVKAPSGADSRILVRDTWNSDILAELKPRAEDIVLYKHRFSGFYQTDLDAVLKRLGVKHLIFTGCTTSICVESTIRDAMFRDYLPILLADCSAEPIGHGLARSNHEASLLTIETLFGWVSSSGDFITGIEASSASVM